MGIKNTKNLLTSSSNSISKEKPLHLYCMPGMAASPKIFEYISLPSPIELHYLSWIQPHESESIEHYALRMCMRVKHKKPFLLGVSFGGIIVQEMAKQIEVEKVIIVSSIKNSNELPLSMKMAKKTNAHKLLPTQWINSLDALTLFTFGKGIQKKIELYQKYLSERNPFYLSWAIDALVNWNQEYSLDKIIHIHGERDTVFPVKNLKGPLHKINAGHAAIITHAKWFNERVPKLLLDQV
jgi:pimeloyl-ACP methyl ester carboxylesterase